MVKLENKHISIQNTPYEGEILESCWSFRSEILNYSRRWWIHSAYFSSPGLSLWIKSWGDSCTRLSLILQLYKMDTFCWVSCMNAEIRTLCFSDVIWWTDETVFCCWHRQRKWRYISYWYQISYIPHYCFALTSIFKVTQGFLDQTVV